MHAVCGIKIFSPYYIACISPQTLQSQQQSSSSKLHISGQNEVSTQNHGHRVMIENLYKINNPLYCIF